MAVVHGCIALTSTAWPRAGQTTGQEKRRDDDRDGTTVRHRQRHVTNDVVHGDDAAVRQGFGGQRQHDEGQGGGLPPSTVEDPTHPERDARLGLIQQPLSRLATTVPMARLSPTEDARGVQGEDGREAGGGEGGVARREVTAE